MDTVTPFRSFTLFQNDVEGLEYTTGNPGTNSLRFGKFLLSLLVFGSFFFLPSIQGTLYGQSTTCVPPAMNGNGAPWSEECYLANNCTLQGSPCNSNDVKILSIYLADEFGNPVPPCIIGDPQTVLVWGVFNNSTGTSRYAIRTRTEAWLNGVFDTEFSACSFDVLISGQTAVALLGEIDMTCGDELQLLNTWIAWNTSASQCTDPGTVSTYAGECNDYSPSKCFKNLEFIDFLTPTFAFACESQSQSTTNVCFVSSVFGGTPPYTYLWNFGDSGTSTMANACHTYQAVSGQFVVTLTVTDSIGQSFAVSDTVDLDVLPCLNQTSVVPVCAAPNSPIACPEVPVFEEPEVPDTCGMGILLTFTDVTTAGACPGDYSITRTWVASDSCGNSGSCSVTIVVQDVLPPSITCVAQTTPINCPAVPAFNPPTVSDACDGTVSLTFSDVTTPGTCIGTFSVTRTWTATDDCLNSATCSSTIVVQDVSPPTITCVAQTTPINCPATPAFNPPTVSDGCDGTVTLTFSDVTTPGACLGAFSVTRTWTATDDCANTATCSATIVVQDNTPPTITCVAQTSPILCPATPVFTPPTATDACDATVAITFSDVTTPGVCPILFSVTRTWTATDDCGNTATCSRTIVVQDLTPPTITCVAQTTPINCPATPVFTPPTATDACDATVAITFSDATTPGTCTGTYSVTRTWTATDDCANTATCSRTITVQDVTPPTITCVAQATPVNCPAAPVFTPPTVSDACDGTVTLTFSDVTTPGTCPGNFSVTRTWTATDDCGGTATCSATIVSQDNTPPTITCVTQVTPINCPATPVFTPPTATDACDATVVITFSDVSTPGACTGTYSTTRTWTATDDCGNTATCSRTIVVQDVTPPTITCVTQVTPIACPATPVFTPPTATDACDATVAITFSDVSTPGTCTGTYSTTRTWTATDDCGNTATCSRTIVVQDVTAPTITCAAQTTPIDCLSAPVFTPPTATDACDLTVAVTFSDVTTPGVCPELASVTRTWTATDDCGNTATCSATIVMLDAQGPTITCPEDATISCEESTLVADLGDATATDVCDPTVTIESFDFFDTPPTTSPEMRWVPLPPGTVSGSCASGSDCATGVICFGLLYTPGVSGTLTSYTTGFFVDCDGANSVVLSNVSCVMTDNSVESACAGGSLLMNSSGNTGGLPITQNVPVYIHQICLQLGPGASILLDEDEPTDLTTSVNLTGGGTATETPSFTNYTAEFDVICAETCIYPSNIYRLFVATDDCGNQSTCIQQITIQDITPPTLTCVAQTTPISCPDTPVFAPPTISDNCDLTVTLTFADVTTPGTCSANYSVTRTWTATDDCLNSSTCSATILVQDVTPPTITCAVTQTSPIACPATPVFTPPTATDACDLTVVITFSDVSTPGTCTGTYSITRTWTATDDCGNTATCSGTIVVLDVTPPTITCAATQTSPIACPATPVFTPPTATDACDLTVSITFSDVSTPGTCTGTYSTTRTWTATDDCGNTATCSGTIVVQDVTSPTLTCVAQTTPIACPATPVFTPPTVSDACDGTVVLTFSDVSTPGTCTGTYSTTRTWTATDDCGNTATCSSTIVVQDVTPPTITCVAQTTPIACPATPVFTPPTATDACDLTVVLTFSDVSTPGTCTGTYSTTRTWTATDDCGNTATCSATIVVQDVTPPTITCAVSQTTPIACPATPVFTPPTATDACDLTVVITFSDVSTPGTCTGTYSTTRTWTATDDCGNTATCSATIVVQDVTPPTITCALTQTTPIACPATPVFTPPTATDACDLTVVITFSDVSTPGTCSGTYSTTRTWTATDDCGNTATCSATIVVQDVTPPTITCALTQTTPIACPATPVFTPPTATDACDLTVVITFSDVSTPGTCTGTYSTTRTWTATDDCGNTATCSATIVVQDITPPTITCALTQTTPIACPATPVFTPPTATDACDLTVVITFSDVSTPGTCTGTYSTTRTWTATDDCGNTATCSATIVVQDITPPTITCALTQTTPIACPATPVFTPPTATDACDLTVVITFSDVSTPGTCTGTYSTTRTWTATDDCGNTATCSATIVVQDVTPPTITCALTQTTPIACPATPVFTPPTATDACDLTLVITFSDVSTPGTCTGTYSTTRTWTATDDCGNTATCSATIVVQDVTPPTITCALTQTTPIACPATPVFTPPTATDACDLTVVITFSDVSTPGTCTGTYSTTRTWTATDDCGNTATCSATIVVQDVTPPTITCALTQTTPIACPATPVFTPPTATDACDLTVVITFSDVSTPGTCTGTYSTTRTWTATDDCGNTATCSATIVVQDVTPPTITCALTQTTPIACPATPVFTPPTATDACDLTVVITFSDVSTPGTCTGTYSTTRTWTATDDCGNTATCSATIVVQDITPPTITCALTQTTPIACPATPVFTPPTATDACDLTVVITFSDVSTPGTCTGTYSTTRTWTATDDCGNTATCSATIVVQDITPPTITCALTQTTPIACPATPVFTPPTATDACDLTVVITFSDVSTPGTCTGTYSTTRTWTATDDCGNTATCSATIVVQDITPPTITCALTQTTPIACPATPVFTPPTATDACDLTVVITFSDVSTPGTCTGTYSTTRTWTATDDCGNTATCSATIVVQDITPPTITCALTQTTPIACPATPVFTPPTATDACDLTVVITFSDVSTPGTCTGTYSTTRTWTATDDCGNTATCSATIVVQDVTPPTITCALTQTTPIACPATPVFTPPTATDACDLTVVITFSDVSTPGTCTGTYSTTRTWTATDDCGNTATCSATIVVQDVTPPTITCALTQTTPIACPATPVFTPPTATDACDLTVVITFSDVSTPGTCTGTYSTTRTWTATDDCGNTATCSATIVVQDVTPPTITCALTQTTPIACPATPVFTPPTATDACDLTVVITFSDVSTPGTCTGTYSTTRTWTATDDCGNTATCSATIVVQDVTPPTITCALTQTTPIACPATPVFTPPTATDACDLTVVITFSDVSTPGTCTGTYSTTRTWTATDDCGNTATCSATIVVQDITPPTITCALTQTTPIACPATPVFTPPTATDACDLTVVITFSDVSTPGTCTGTYSTTRTWTATDDCGNTATCSATIVVQDITPPTITCALTQTTPIACPATPVFTPPTATDACDLTVVITFSDVSTPGTCTGTYSTTRTWTATDDCGNTATCSATIVVQDITPPTITCALTQTTPIACPATPVFTPPTATDACDLTVVITFSDVSTPGTCTGTYSTTRTWTATDDCGNTATCSATIVVQDITPPTITCALTQTTPIACPATPVFTPPTATDACDLTVVITFSDVSTPGTCTGTYSTTRTWTATDDCGNTATCSATIVVQDVTPPTITCALTQTTPIACPATPVFTPPTATDACDLTVVITFSDVSTPGTCTGTYSTTRTWTATDDCGNTATCSATIVVQDITPPTITCALTQTTPIACPATPVFTPPTATDACDLTVVITFSDVSTPGTCTGTYSTTRTWTATDDCGNTATCSATIVVQDITPPTITCAVTQTTPIACPATPVFTPPTATDACDLTVVITFSDVSTPGTCTGTYSTTRTWTATDDCGNTATCSATIVVQDITPPTITCAVTQTTPIACPATPVFTPPTATDACDLTVVITFSDVSTPGTCTGTYSTTRTWTATDDCGNTATCSATIVVQDITPPTITCALTQTTPIACPATPVFTPPTATDACDLTVVITFSDVSTPGTCTGTYSTTRTWTATDDCGNTATCSATIVVQDITPPTITCALTQTTPIACPATPVFTPPTATDACDLTVVITFSDVSTPGTCTGTYSTTRTWTATDDCGNTATCSATIVVQDITPPTITCAVTQTTPIACPATPVFTPPTATDACDLTVVITFSDVSTPGTCTGTYSTTRTWTATDDCGNTATCSATIVVQDITPPTITCVAQTSPIACPATPVFTPPTATDACDLTVVITFSDVSTPGTCTGTYSTTRTWTATDDCGNTATCSGTIVVQDITPPTITCATQVTPITCPALPAFLPPTATDACDLTVTITFSDVSTPGTCTGTYSTTRTWTATDDCGNTATCSGTIVVQDITPPTITCVTQTSPIACPATPVFTPPTATDACDLTVAITFSDVSTPGTCTGTYSTTRTWTATDDCGNTATCSGTIVVQDITPPTITCVTQTSPIACPATPVFTPPTATDACDLTVVVTFSDVSTPGTCTGTYSTTRTWTATDDCGNTATCSGTIVVQDITPPTITCVTQTSPIACPATPVFTPPTATDACDLTVAITFSDLSTPGTCTGTYSVRRTWTATDDCGNTATCSGTIVVQDVTPPTITCVTQTSPINCPATPVFTPPTATDACDLTVAITFSDLSTPGTCTGTYSVRRTWTATDDCGNTATCSGTIVVQDITPPTITCATQTSPIACPATPVFTPPTATDACDLTVAVTFSDVSTPGTCTGTYSTTRTWTATDDCGNTATCSGTIVVQDITPPTITCVAQTSPIACPATPVFAPPTATDACDVSVAVTFSDVSTPGTCTGTYSTTRTWTATDDCGNTATCSGTIVVQDITPPTITCVAQTTPINCPATPVFTPPTATDACDLTVAITFSDLTTPGTCTGTYSVRRTWTATDDCGNTATCSGTVVVQDITPPSITCPIAVTVTCASSQPAPNIAGVTTSDACSTPVVTFVSDVTVNQTCFNRYMVNRTYRSTDACGNSATCIQVITVFDNIPPTITCPAAITVQCAALVPVPNIATVTTSDNCSGPAPVVTFVSDVTTNQTCVNRYTLTRTYRSTDACGNSATCAQVITVFDNTPPTITCPANITVQCANLVPVPSPATVVTSDNCAGTPPVVTFVSDVTTNQTCINRYTLTRTYRATDACGNSATCTQVITVFDNTPPVITPVNLLLVGVPNNGTVEVQCFGQDPNWNLPTFGPADVTATDNCTGTVVLTFDDVLIDEGNCPVDGYINRYRLRWMATDACGNSSSYTVFLNLIDTIPPVILGVPEDITVNCDEVPDPPIMLTALDECLCACVVEMEQDGPNPGCQDGQIITRTWEATDYCGNVTIAQQHITLVDNEGPVMTIEEPSELAGLPNGTVLEFTCNEGGIPAYFDELNVGSVSSPVVCGGLPTITFDQNLINSINCERFGYITERTFTWTGVDACGNVNTMTITAHLVDTEDPTIVGVPDMTCIGDPALDLVEAVDNCEKAGLIHWDVEIPSPCGDGTALFRTYEAQDQCGNFARDTVTLIPNDGVPPTMEFVNPDLIGLGQGEFISVECDVDGEFFTPWGLDDVTIADDCPGATLEFEQTIMQVYDGCEDGALFWLQLTWTATDLCGNTDSLFLYVYVKDETPPVFDAYSPVVTIGCNDEWPIISATDNCNEVIITSVDNIIATDCIYEYDVIRTLTATDLCGNFATATQTIHVGDHSGPDITGVDTLVCQDLTLPNVTAFDPCANQNVPVTLTEVNLVNDCGGRVIERTWSATDICGNVATITQRIVLDDTIPPIILVPTWSIIRKFQDNDHNFVRLSDRETIRQLNELDESSVFTFDLCDGEIVPTFTVEITLSQNCLTDGWWQHRVYTWVATDVCGNSTVLTFELDILDDVSPNFFSVPADETVICGDLPDPPTVLANDDSGDIIAEFLQTIIEIPGQPGHFRVIRTWTAIDPCGNRSSATQTITWIPDTFVECEIILPPVVDCNSHGVIITSDVGGGIPPFTYVWDVIGQECFIQTGQGTPTITIYVGFFDVTISLTVTDAYGCQSVCSTVLECFDPLDLFAGNTPTGQNQANSNDPNNIVQGSNEDYLRQLNYWPNPANTMFNISFDAAVERDVEISFINFLGEVVLTDHLKAHVGANTRKIDVTKLPEGTYLFQVKTDKEIHAKGIVIMR